MGDILIKKEMSREDLKQIYAVFEPLGLPMDVISDGIVYGVPSKAIILSIVRLILP